MSTWWTILGSAGVLTIAWNSFVRTKDAQQARTAKLHNQRHTALTVASKLEDFARRCEVTIADATRALDEASRLVDYAPLAGIKLPPFLFSDTIQWRDLDPAEVSKLQAFATDVGHSMDSIWRDDFSEPDAAVLDIRHHCGRFGQLAWATAEKIRSENGLQAIDDHGMKGEFQTAMIRHEERLERAQLANEKMYAHFAAGIPIAPVSDQPASTPKTSAGLDDSAQS
jgi:hypothetical protein